MKPRSIASSAPPMLVIAKGMQKGFIFRCPCAHMPSCPGLDNSRADLQGQAVPASCRGGYKRRVLVPAWGHEGHLKLDNKGERTPSA